MKNPEIASNLTDADRAALLEGQHGLGAEAGVETIAARIAQNRAHIKEAIGIPWERLQGTINDARQRKIEAVERSARLHIEMAGKEPEFLRPMIIVAAAMFVAITEAVLLRPIVEGLAIVNPLFQLIVAIGIVVMWMILVDVVFKLMAYGPIWRIGGILVLLAAAAGLGVMGWWRRDVIALSVHSPTVQRLYENHSTAIALTVVALTVIFPFAAALAIWRYLPELTAALRWRRIMRKPAYWDAQIHRCRAEQNVLGGSLKAQFEGLDAKEREDRERYLKFYKLGERLATMNGVQSELPDRGVR